jgi:3'-phosphoadenosine 5'-phosphosulfate sulfotransferase (PAPS reductase)/FAD synthetase
VRNPYKLPEGNVLLSISGGRTSGYMLKKILQTNPDDMERTKVVFCNTGREMPETLDFVQDMSVHWGVEFVWLEYNRRDGKVTFDIVNHNTASRHGEPFETLLNFKGYNPNAVARFCTQELKVRTIKRYLLSIGWDYWTSAIGIRADEAQRVKTKRARERWKNWYPLNDAGVIKRDIMDFWESEPFDLALYGRNGVTPKGNCDGCFLKSEATLAMMWREHPDRMEWWSRMEDQAGGSFHKSRTYKELGNFVQAQGDWIFDNEAFLCQADGGECTG